MAQCYGGSVVCLAPASRRIRSVDFRTQGCAEHLLPFRRTFGLHQLRETSQCASLQQSYVSLRIESDVEADDSYRTVPALVTGLLALGACRFQACIQFPASRDI